MAQAFPDFVHDLHYRDLPEPVRDFGRRCLLDLIGVAVCGSETELSRIIRDHAVCQFGAGERSARMLFDGRAVSPAGAALAGGMTIDAVDAHDGHKLTKGHVGCGVLPAALALAEAEGEDDGAAFLTAIVIGYELGSRLGIALHRTVPDYHTSGAWVAVACAALVRGTVGPAEVSAAAFDDPEILRLSDGMRCTESDAFNAAFPGRRIAQVTLQLTDGRRLVSESTEARGDPEAPVSNGEVRAKFHDFADPVLGATRAGEVERAVMALGDGGDLASLAGRIMPPAKPPAIGTGSESVPSPARVRR